MTLWESKSWRHFWWWNVPMQNGLSNEHQFIDLSIRNWFACQVDHMRVACWRTHLQLHQNCESLPFAEQCVSKNYILISNISSAPWVMNNLAALCMPKHTWKTYGLAALIAVQQIATVHQFQCYQRKISNENFRWNYKYTLIAISLKALLFRPLPRPNRQCSSLMRAFRLFIIQNIRFKNWPQQT